MPELQTRLNGLSSEKRKQLAEVLRLRRAEAQQIRAAPRDHSDFPLSFNQERLWFLDQLAPGNAFYNVSLGQQIARVDAKTLEHAIAQLVARQEILRTVFPTVDGGPVQRILDSVTIPVETVSLAHFAPVARDGEASRIAASHAALPFDLARGPLVRATLIELDGGRTSFILSIHHILVDASSMRILMRELGLLYQAARTGNALDLPPLKLQYADYSIWQREQFGDDTEVPELDYWREALSDLADLEMPHDRPRSSVQTFSGGQVDIRMPRMLARSVTDFAGARSVTPFIVLLSGFMSLLHRLCDQDDITVGVPVANRPRRELEDIVGFFTHPIVLRADLSGDPTFCEVVDRVGRTTFAGLENQSVPFSRLVSELRPCPELNRNPLFQVSFQHLALDPSARGSGRNQSNMAIDRGSAIFDLSFNLWETSAGVEGQAEFNSDLFDRDTIERMVQHYCTLLEAACTAPETPVKALPLMTADERKRVLENWSIGPAAKSDDPGLLDKHLIESCSRFAERVAVRVGNRTLSYRDLEEQSATLAAQLAGAGCGPNDRVGVLTGPTPDLIVALLAVLRCGAAYVPLDAAFPQDRLVSMTQDAGARWVLTSSGSDRGVDIPGVCTMLIDGTGGECAQPAVPADRSGDDLAYILFTSGSTGRPKGVMISHRAVMNYLNWCAATYPVDGGCGAPLCSPVTSDMSVTTLFLPLLTGKTVELLDPRSPVEELERRLGEGAGYDFVKLTPSHLEALRTLAVDRPTETGTHAFVVGGEALDSATLTPWTRHAPAVMIYNEYGPTEATVGCCVHGVAAGQIGRGAVPIGRPIAATRLYVLDRRGEPVPEGIPGELHIGGKGLSLGYAGLPDLTDDRFVADPFGGKDERIYRTGDQVRWRAGGVLEYIGRYDDQLKILGYRVEPGEVETVLREAPQILDAAVIAQEMSHGEKRLVAFTTPALPQGADRAEWATGLRSWLAARLPRHMIPGLIEPVDALPLSANGKVDRCHLSTMFAAPTSASREPVAPRTALEKVICHVWTDVLGTGSLGVHDDFFMDLGGHSLLAAKAVARLRDQLWVELALRTLFEAPTVATLAQAIVADTGDPNLIEEAAGLVLQVLDMSEADVRAMLADDAPGPGAAN